jgi:hypothetical protein
VSAECRTAVGSQGMRRRRGGCCAQYHSQVGIFHTVLLHVSMGFGSVLRFMLSSPRRRSSLPLSAASHRAYGGEKVANRDT